MIYFRDKNNQVPRPLYKANKRGNSSSSWKKAYQSIKYNRNKYFSHANMKNAISAMAALYLLNIYYREEHFDFSSSGKVRSDFDASLGSDIFSIQLADAYMNQVNQQNATGGDDKYVECTYMSTYSDATYSTRLKKEDSAMEETHNALNSSKGFRDFIHSGGNISDCRNYFSIAQRVCVWVYKNKIIPYPSKAEQYTVTINSPEYKSHSAFAHNAQSLEKIAKDGIDALCERVGWWSFAQRTVLQYDIPITHEYFNLPLQVILNKSQSIYSVQKQEEDANKETNA